MQVTLAKLESEGKEFVQVPLAQISWFHHISLLSKVKKRITQPMRIALYETEKLFADVASALPQIEELEEKLEKSEGKSDKE